MNKKKEVKLYPLYWICFKGIMTSSGEIFYFKNVENFELAKNKILKAVSDKEACWVLGNAIIFNKLITFVEFGVWNLGQESIDTYKRYNSIVDDLETNLLGDKNE